MIEFSAEHKNRLREALMGKRNSPNTEFQKGFPPPSHKEGCNCFRCSKTRAIHKPDCTCCFCRKVGHKFTREETLGSNNVNWNGGINKNYNRKRSTTEYRLWRKNILKRDNFTCSMCHSVGGLLHAHHIKSFSKFPELRFSIDNGVTLCKLCHDSMHKFKN